MEHNKIVECASKALVELIRQGREKLPKAVPIKGETFARTPASEDEWTVTGACFIGFAACGAGMQDLFVPVPDDKYHDNDTYVAQETARCVSVVTQELVKTCAIPRAYIPYVAGALDFGVMANDGEGGGLEAGLEQFKESLTIRLETGNDC